MQHPDPESNYKSNIHPKAVSATMRFLPPAQGELPNFQPSVKAYTNFAQIHSFS